MNCFVLQEAAKSKLFYRFIDGVESQFSVQVIFSSAISQWIYWLIN